MRGGREGERVGEGWGGRGGGEGGGKGGGGRITKGGGKGEERSHLFFMRPARPHPITRPATGEGEEGVSFLNAPAISESYCRWPRYMRCYG